MTQYYSRRITMKHTIITIVLAFSMLCTVTFAADAGVEQHVNSNDIVTLDGTASMPDKGGEIVKYKWKQIKRKHTPKVELLDKKSAIATFMAPEVEETTELIFKLKTVEYYNCEAKGSKGSQCKKGSKGSKDKKKCKKYATKDFVNIFVHPVDNNGTDNNESNTTGVNISGKITDIDGLAISAASVTIGTQVALTDADGIYTISNIEVSPRVSVDVTHPNYLSNSRIVEVNDTDVTLDIKLGSAKATLTFSSASGGTVSHDGASVILPSNGYVDSNGIPYTGDILVKMSYYPITTLSGRATFPGTFEGIDGNDTFPIQSYGFMNVELSDTQGNPLNLDGNSSATLTFPRDYNIYPQPDTIPLWYYDTVQGYWVQEGEATRVGYSSYVGTVMHFTSWNLDAKGPRAELTGCVEDQSGIKVTNAEVQFSSVNWRSRIVPTDENGNISVFNILAGAELTFSAYKKIGAQWFYGEYPTSINLQEGENRILPDCIILQEANLPDGNIQVTGRIVDFSDNPIPNAQFITINGVTNVTIDANGNFDVSIPAPDSIVNSIGDGECNTNFTLQANKTLYDLGDVYSCMGGDFDVF